MNKETKQFVKQLLHKYNSSQKVIDLEDIIYDNTFHIGYVDGELVEMEANEMLQLIVELCEALDITEETK